jgi:hypothetical protein
MKKKEIRKFPENQRNQSYSEMPHNGDGSTPFNSSLPAFSPQFPVSPLSFPEDISQNESEPLTIYSAIGIKKPNNPKGFVRKSDLNPESNPEEGSKVGVT